MANIPSIVWWLAHLALLGFQVTYIDSAPQPQTRNTLMLMISFDGFRWDYLDVVKRAGFETPNFNRLIADGVTVESGGMINVFPTVTFPNHHSLVTGLYPSNHGVVQNSFYDPVYDEVLNVTYDNQIQMTDGKWWNNGTNETNPGDRKIPEPIWIANQRGQEDIMAPNARRSGVMFWPSGEVKTYDTQAFHHRPLNNSISNFTRIDELVEWFSDSKAPINLGLLYFNEPDSTGHTFGPDSQQIIDMVVGLDKVVGHLISKLMEVGLFSQMNLIVTSDHGMITVPEENHIALEKYVNIKLYNSYASSPALHIWPKEGQEDTIYKSLVDVKHMKIYRKKDIPEEYVYRYNRRIPPLLVLADPGYMTMNSNNTSIPKGSHGYNNSLHHMHPIFIAHGPAFKSNYVAKTFVNVDIYPLMCYLLGVEPGPHDGSLSNIEHILKVHP